VSLDLHHAVAAIRADELVGVAGFKHAGNGLVGVQYEAMRQAFGWIGGLWRVLALSIFSRRETPGELLMDGIVVDNSLRGQGIGSQLLDAVVAFAAERGYRRVRLDVVDTNPRARQLYERKGFVATQTASYPYLRAIFNFGSATTLVKTLE
jgi:ribosomal protein S18 acetylase RimI-like enzyme